MRALKTWKAWTTGDIERVRQWRLAGVSPAECARRLGRTRASISLLCAAQSIKVQRRRDRSEFLALLTLGWSYRQIGERMGFSEHSARCWAYKIRRSARREEGRDRRRRPGS